MKKFGLIALAVLVVLAAGGTFFLLSNLNSIVEKVIESEGTKAVQTPVNASGVEISIREGRGTIAGITIANPDGFQTDPAFSLDEITVDLDLESLRNEPIVIEEIRIRAPAVRAEILPDGSTNIGALNRNLQQFVANTGESGQVQAGSEMKKIRIKHFVCEEGQIAVDASGLGLGQRSLSLPAIKIDEIGGAAGSAPDAIAQAVLKALTRTAIEAIAREGIKNTVQERAEDELKEKVGGLLQKIGK